MDVTIDVKGEKVFWTHTYVGRGSRKSSFKHRVLQGPKQYFIQPEMIIIFQGKVHQIVKLFGKTKRFIKFKHQNLPDCSKL